MLQNIQYNTYIMNIIYIIVLKLFSNLKPEESVCMLYMWFSSLVCTLDQFYKLAQVRVARQVGYA